MQNKFVESVRTKKIACLGAGYVGGPTMATIAERCPDVEVYVLDLNQQRIDAWNSGCLPIYEPGLKEVVEATRDKNLFFSTDVARYINECDIIFVAVNTPTKLQGKGAGRAADLRNWELAGRSIAEHAETSKIVIEKSTVPVRTAEALAQVLQARAPTKASPDRSFVILSNPEFLAEGTAMKDLKDPDRILIGGPEETEEGRYAVKVVADIYRRWCKAESIITTNTWSSELAKLVANGFLAQRISSINSISMLCEKTGADVEQVASAVGRDSRIGSKFMRSSIGFGGSCFQKDILNLVYILESFNLPEAAAYWEQVVLMNNFSKKRFANRIVDAMFSTVSGKKLAVFGFAYKKNTGDARDTPAVDVCQTLLLDGAELHVYDPKVQKETAIAELQKHGIDTSTDIFRTNFIFSPSSLDAITGAHGIVILTEWDEFIHYDYTDFFSKMKQPAFIFDGRNILDPQKMFNLGFEYHGVGRATLTHLRL